MYGNFKATLVVVVFSLTAVIGQARAMSITDTIGDQDFTDGSILAFPDFIGASAGDPANFNSVSGSDPGGTFANITFSHNFELGGSIPTTAALTLGIYDHDALAAGEDTLDIFFDGIQQNDDVWRGSVADAGYYIRTMNVESSLLLDGILNVQIVGTPVTNYFPGNFVGIDFSSLTIRTSAVPLPAAAWLFATGLLALSGFNRRKSAAA